MSRTYKGACGASITENRYSDTIVYICDYCRSLQCDDGLAYPEDLCENCSEKDRRNG